VHPTHIEQHGLVRAHAQATAAQAKAEREQRLERLMGRSASARPPDAQSTGERGRSEESSDGGGGGGGGERKSRRDRLRGAKGR
jgi:hypothetical protein